jgi:hypothetical protein
MTDADDLLAAIAAAIRGRDFPAVPALLDRLEAADPAEAQRVRDRIDQALLNALTAPPDG